MKMRGNPDWRWPAICGAIILIAGCATAPTIGTVKETQGSQGYSDFETVIAYDENPETAEFVEITVTYDQQYQQFDINYMYRDTAPFTVEKLEIAADDETFTLPSGSPMRYGTKKKGVRYEVEKDSIRAELDMLRSMADAATTTITIVGGGGEIDFVIDTDGKQGIRDITGIYDEEVEGSDAALIGSFL